MSKKVLALVLWAVMMAACSSDNGEPGDTKDQPPDSTGDVGWFYPDHGNGNGEDADNRLLDGWSDEDPLEETGGGDEDGKGTDKVKLTDTDANGDDLETTSDDGETTPGPDVPEVVIDDGSFKSAELGLKILGPSATGVAQALGASIQVAGLVVGKPDAIKWKSETGQSGYAEGMPFWLSGKVDLVQGDNLITVTAVKGNEEASDTVVITYNPAFLFGDVLRVRPSAVFTNTKTKLVFTLDMGLYTNFEPSTLKLCQCTEDGECVSDVHTMLDDGQVGISCDEVGEDSVFSWCKSYTLSEPGKACFRTHAVVKAGYQQYTAYSPVTCVDVVDHFTQAACESIQAIQLEADALYWDTLAVSDAATARQTVVNLLQTKPDVGEVGMAAQGFGVWVRFANGILGGFNFSPPGTRGGQNEEGAEQSEFEQLDAPLTCTDPVLIESKRSVVLAPENDEFGASDEAIFVQNVLDKSECPAFVLDSPKKNAAANLSAFRSLHEYGVIAITGHGDSYFKTMSPAAKKAYGWRHMGSQEVIWSGEAVDCTNLLQTSDECSEQEPCGQGAECIFTTSSGVGTSVSGICVDYKQVDIMTGRVVVGPDRYGVLPSFVAHYQGRGYPSSLVYLGTCRSLWNGTLGMEFYGAGARSVVGYSGYVTTPFAYEQGTNFFSSVVEEMTCTGQALPEVPIEDPQNPGTVVRLLGAPNLLATNADLINPSWETGDLTGWQKTGDGRVVSRLGITVPVEGKFMGLISTGMGYTPQVGEIYQTFCIPEDKIEMSFYWKYYSEEFKEWCGSKFQDTFEATLDGDDGMITFVNVSVDDLCPPTEQCPGCGSQYDALLQSDVIFDQGDVWNSAWRKATGNVMALAGAGAVTLRFFATDKGDSIYDTAILLDTVKFK